MNMDLSMDDTFANAGLGLQRQLEPFVSEHHQIAGDMQPSNSLAMGNTGAETFNLADFATPRHSIALNQTNVSPSTAIMTQGSSRGKLAGNVVNPSVIFSSPGRPGSASNSKLQNDVLKPYAHQLQDAEIEKELRTRRPKRKRGLEIESPAVKAATQALREAEDETSTTSSDCAVAASFGGPMRPSSRHSRRSQRHSKGSSDHRFGPQTHSALSQRNKRTSITLSIDESGRASTQTTFLDEPAESRSKSRMDVDSGSESSDESSVTSDDELVFSQPSSFAYPAERQKKAKSERHYGSTAYSHSHKSSDASTRVSLNTPEVAMLLGSNRRQSQPHPGKSNGHSVRFNDASSFVAGALNPEESEAETVVETNEEKGHAQEELKKMLRRRSSQTPSATTTLSSSRRNVLDNRRTQNGPLAFSHSSMRHVDRTPNKIHLPTSSLNMSPTTITDPDLNTPSTGQRSSGSNGATRCVCSRTEGNGQLMVQW